MSEELVLFRKIGLLIVIFPRPLACYQGTALRVFALDDSAGAGTAACTVSPGHHVASRFG